MARSMPARPRHGVVPRVERDDGDHPVDRGAPHGRGFAVLAAEIKDFAGQTARTTGADRSGARGSGRLRRVSQTRLAE